MKKTLVIASLATCLVSGYALAAEPATGAAGESPATHKAFIKLDTNKDGYIESTEAKHNAALHKDFAKVAKQGKLSEAEFAAWEVQHTTKTKTMNKTESGTMQKNMPEDSMGKPSTGGGYK